MPTYISAYPYMPGALRGQKLPGTMKPELQMVVNYHVGAEN